MRIDAVDDLTIKLQHQAQAAVSRRMLRPQVHREIADRSGHALPLLKFELL
jgi:hypothetical protein